MRARTLGWRLTAVAVPLLSLPALAGLAMPATAATTATTGTTLSNTVGPVASGAAVDLGAYDAAQQLRLTIGLKTPRPAEEQTFLASLQDKKSPQFHKYLTQAEWTARFGPSADSEAAVVSWAKDAGLAVTRRYPNRLVVDVTGSAGAIAKALHVSMHTYRLGATTFFANDRDVVLPSALAGVQSIGGLNSYSKMKPASSTATVPSFPAFAAGEVSAGGPASHADGSRTALQAAMKERAAKRKTGTAGQPTPSLTGGSYDPTDIYSSQGYDFDALNRQGHCCNPFDNPGSSPKETSIAIATLGSQQVSDMVGFQARYSYLAYNFNEIYVDGTPTCCDGEGTMDLEWATATANSFGSFADTAHVWMYDGATNFQSTFTDIYNTMVSENRARTMSTSWACEERSGGAFTCDSGVLNTQHNIFNNMAGLGWSMVAASGDHGAFGNCSNLGVMFPGSDPNVTAAGGTTLRLNAGPVYSSETGWGGNPFGCSGNGGGSTGGCSVYFSAPAYQGSAYPCGSGSRSVPDIALNGDWYNTPQNLYFQSGWQGNGGTSIVAPEIAGFLAQENAYLTFLGSACGLGSGTRACAPLGSVNPTLYLAMQGSAPHKPSYDITSGCSSNNIGTGWCATTGYDLVTGWGSANMLQLAWALNYRSVAEGTPPSVIFSGPTTGVWYNTDQTVFWAVTDSGGSFPASGVAGYTKGWDAIPADPTSHATPGSGDSFYAGPQYPAASGGTLTLSSAGQGCHTAHVRGWDNMGLGSGDRTYGSLCYDSVAPSVTGPQPSVVPQANVTASGVPVRLTWSGSDASSGVSAYRLYKKVDSGAFALVGSLASPTTTVTLPAGHSYQFEVNAVDRAGNTSSTVLGRVFKVNLVQETASSVAYGGTWSQGVVVGASGGSVKASIAAGRTAKLTYNGFALEWLTTLGSTRGAASVSFDGAAPLTVSTYLSGPQVAAHAIISRAGTSGTHTVLVKNLATSGHPRVDIDAFMYLS